MSDDPFAAEDAAKPAVLEDEVTGADLEEDDEDEQQAAADASAGANGDAAASADGAAPTSTAADAEAAAFFEDGIGLNATSTPTEHVEVQESAKFQEWQQSHNKFLDDKAARESAKREEEIEQGRQWLDNFYKEREAKKGAKRQTNQEAEAKFVAERDSALTKGESWERAAFFIDFQLKSEEGAQDISRMRELLIALKHGK